MGDFHGTAELVVAVVKEFYVNVKEVRNNVVQLREILVAFDSTSINAYYETIPIDNDEFTEYR